MNSGVLVQDINSEQVHLPWYSITQQNRSSHWRSSVRNFIEKEILAQVFPCEFCEIFKNTHFTEHLRTTAAEQNISIYQTTVNTWQTGIYNGLINGDVLFSSSSLGIKSIKYYTIPGE